MENMYKTDKEALDIAVLEALRMAGPASCPAAMCSGTHTLDQNMMLISFYNFNPRKVLTEPDLTPVAGVALSVAHARGLAMSILESTGGFIPSEKSAMVAGLDGGPQVPLQEET